jgi:hypothetical protein
MSGLNPLMVKDLEPKVNLLRRPVKSEPMSALSLNIRDGEDSEILYYPKLDIFIGMNKTTTADYYLTHCGIYNIKAKTMISLDKTSRLVYIRDL